MSAALVVGLLSFVAGPPALRPVRPTISYPSAVVGMEEITVQPLTKEEAETKFGVSKWGTWGCGVSKFDWECMFRRSKPPLAAEHSSCPL